MAVTLTGYNLAKKSEFLPLIFDNWYFESGFCMQHLIQIHMMNLNPKNFVLDIHIGEAAVN